MERIMDDGPRTAPSGTVTFLFTDIEGNTKRWEKHLEIMRAGMGDTTFEKARSRGRDMTTDQSIEYSREA
jgi:hypothetical protein